MGIRLRGPGESLLTAKGSKEGDNAMKPATYAPVYAAALYPGLAMICREEGYCLAVHGSLQRDFDLICIPWIATPSTPQAVVDRIVKSFDIRQIGNPGLKEHGRMAWTISIGHGECALDLSFMPISDNQKSVVAAEPSIANIIANIGTWHAEIFPDASAKRVSRKLLEEAAELLCAATTKEKRMEWCDCMIVLFAWFWRYGDISASSSLKEIERRFEIVKSRPDIKERQK